MTGGGGDIGRASAIALARAGAHVHLIGRTAERLMDAASEIDAFGGRASTLQLDVTDAAAVEETFGAASVDVLVNSAGTNIPQLLDDVRPADFDALFDVNVKASFFVTQQAVRAMRREHRSGSVIMISSQMGHVGGPKRALYCGTKWAIEGMTRALALELAPEGIRVNTVAPTFVETEMTRAYLEDPEFKDFVLGSIPMGMMARPDDVAGAVRFLAEDASRMITGTSIRVDGGWTAQ
ncbi:SDR family NAD(P)-dependent oxidoreductase [Paramicrobacterium fandaimingii]|uniref:SDR family NAD(P)-dependent oxidoreductase n=1 Tax=Paramicrobacterium fandaimingii TaxID=2708079 RepID=UPI001C3F9D95|nr:SDR family oxidoreductase [Microbacterium fandaimingii]